MSKLAEIQQKLKAPKGQKNSFGNYNYRSCEDILEAVKPLLGDWSLTLSDDIVEVGGRVYVKATAELKYGDTEPCNVGGQNLMQPVHSATAYAREAETKKGMDDAQITGSASSYARKYALNGLFCIDDTKDADATYDNGKAPQKRSKPAAAAPEHMALKAAKQALVMHIENDRAGMYDGDMGTMDFVKAAVKAVFQKATLNTEAEVDKLRAEYDGGRIDKGDGSLLEKE